MRWGNIKDRLPRETDTDKAQQVVTRYFVEDSLYFDLEHYVTVGDRWITAHRCDWLEDKPDSAPVPKETTHIRKVEL